MTTTTAGDRYRFDHPTFATVTGDMRIPAADPGPGDHVPAFDLPTVRDGRRA